MTGSSGEDRLFKIEENFGNAPLNELSHAQRVFMLVWRLEAEVNNGGFEQYFFNKSDAPEAAAALSEIGATQCANVVRKAVELAQRTGVDWRDDLARQTAMVGFPDDVKDILEELDEAFLAYPDPLSELLCAYVDARPIDFP